MHKVEESQQYSEYIDTSAAWLVLECWDKMLIEKSKDNHVMGKALLTLCLVK